MEEYYLWLVLQRATPSSLLFTALASLAGLFLVYFYLPYWRIRSIPGPPAIFPVGHLHLIAKHGPDVYSILAKKYGPIYRFHMGRQPLVIVADPELCKEVGIKKFKSIPNRSLPSPITACPLLQKGIFSAKDSRWSAMKNAVVSQYQPSQLASLIPAMQSHIESATMHLSKIGEDEDFRFSDLTVKMATDVIGQAAFGVNFGLLKDAAKADERRSRKDEVVASFAKLHEYSTNSLKMDLAGSFSIILGLVIPILQEPFRQVLKRMPWTADHRIEQTNYKLAKKAYELVTMKQNEEKGSKDFISAILRATESDTTMKKFLTTDYITSLAYEHLIAGTASTSFTLSAIIYLVSMHPEVEKKLIAEIDGFGPHNLVPTAEDLQHKFPYLDQVIKETTRFYTASPVTARETSKQVEVGGYVLPKGTWVWIAIGVLAKDPKHFPEPNIFRPERFDPNCGEEKKRHPYAHIPFGIGPRACLGQKFSWQEFQLSVIHLYRNFTFNISPNMESPAEFEYGIILNFRHGVKLRVTPRSKN